MDRFSGGRQALQRKAAETFLESDGATAVLTILTTTEARLLDAVTTQHDLLDLDTDAQVPEPDQRAERLRALWQAKLAGEFPAFWVEHYADLDNPSEAAQYAALDPGEWETTLSEWADRFRRQGMDGSDRHLAGGHVQARYGVDLDTFERLVVEWDDDRESDELRDVVAGPIEAAIAGIEATNERLQEARQDA